MCGIVAGLSTRNVVSTLIEGLRRLEYRGYDSAGLAVVNGSLHRLRSVGRVAALAELAALKALEGTVGIAHTRWATHGPPSEGNAHPHASRDGLAVVHNGIIENYEEIKARLTTEGYDFVSDTDTEVIAHLIHSRLAWTSDLLGATRDALSELKGSYAIAVVSERHPSTLILARNGAPLLLGLGDGEVFAASDASALLPMTRRMVDLQDGDVTELTAFGFRIVDAQGHQVVRPVRESELSLSAVELGTHRHFMHKEIFEQPSAVAATLGPVCASRQIRPELFGPDASAILSDVDRVTILACGTSYHAGLVGRYWIESLARLPVNVEIASEYRYRQSVPDPRALIITISQSGETADTIAALHHAVAFDQTRTLSVCNVPESSIARASRLSCLTKAGLEIGVASTKAFTSQLAALFVLTLILAKSRGLLSAEAERRNLDALARLPEAISRVLQLEDSVAAWSRSLADKQHALFLGRGIHYPIAMEGALKLKEISYIHAEAYPAGELKHGPLALVDGAMPVVAIAPCDALIEKLKSNLQEVRARGGQLYVFADAESDIHAAPGINVLRLTEHWGPLSPLLHVVPLQLLAYHSALIRGADVDKPRNLAKSVTVE
jgi:glucosamine--fructose-6-phosphate aminotransferase (isomerizing)